MANPRSVWFGLFALLLTSCSPEKGPEEIPAGILVPDSMVQVMADVHLAESRLLLTGAGQTASLPKKAYLLEVLHNRNIDTTAFNKSFAFYAAHPELMDQVYEKVIEEIGRRQAVSGRQ